VAQPFVIALDPAELAGRFASEAPDDEAIDADADSVQELYALQDRRADLERWLDRIPFAEADAIELTLLGKRQSDIATIFGVTQAAVSYRLHRAIQRLKYLSELPLGIDEEIESLLPEVLSDDLDLRIVREMWTFTSQSHVAELLGITQGRVRFRFMRAVDRVEKAASDDPKFKCLAIGLQMLSKNFNILFEIHGCGCTKVGDRALEI
jgi:predicted transcriptional regulator